MTDEKKLKNEELTDEHTNEAAGGTILRANKYTCQGGCGRSYSGSVPFYVNGRPYCANCYGKYQQSQYNLGDKPDPNRRLI